MLFRQDNARTIRLELQILPTKMHGHFNLFSRLKNILEAGSFDDNAEIAVIPKIFKGSRTVGNLIPSRKVI